MIKLNIYVLGLIFLLIIGAIYIYKRWVKYNYDEIDIEEDIDKAFEEGYEDFEEEFAEIDDGPLIEGFAKKKRRKWLKRIWKGLKIAGSLTPLGLLSKGGRKLVKKAYKSKYGQRLKRKLSEKAKEKAKEKIMAYLEKKVKEHPKIQPVIETLKKDWVAQVAQKIRENPALITTFSLLATNQAFKAYSENAAGVAQNQKEMVEARLRSDPRIQEAMTLFQQQPELRERIKELMQYPVVKDVADELASNNGIIRKTKNVIRIIRDWLRSLRRRGETSVDEDNIQVDTEDLGSGIDEFEKQPDVKNPLPQINHDDFEGYRNYSNREWNTQFTSINPKHAWDVNTEINI